jgi:hypothetical protein
MGMAKITVEVPSDALAAALDGFDFAVGIDERHGEVIELARLAGADIARQIHGICAVEVSPVDPAAAFAELRDLGARLTAIADALYPLETSEAVVA